MEVNNQTVEMLKMTKPYTMVCQCLRSFLPSSSSSWRFPSCLAFTTWVLLAQLASCSLNVSSSAAAGHASLSNSSISFLRGRHGGGSSSGFPNATTRKGIGGYVDSNAAEKLEARQLLLFNLYQNADNRPPGSMATLWQEGDPKLGFYTKERKEQRLALATVYYATRGDDWTVNTGWLSYEIDEVSKNTVILFLEMLLLPEQTDCRT